MLGGSGITPAYGGKQNRFRVGMASLAWPPSEVIGNRQSIRVKLECIRGCGHERMAVACRPAIRLDYFDINSRRFYQTTLESYEYRYDTWNGGNKILINLCGSPNKTSSLSLLTDSSANRWHYESSNSHCPITSQRKETKKLPQIRSVDPSKPSLAEVFAFHSLTYKTTKSTVLLTLVIHPSQPILPYP